MTAEEYYKEVFNPEASVEVNKDGFFHLRESSASRSHVLVTDVLIGAYHYDENFEHKKLLNPEKCKGFRQRHDFILLNKDDENNAIEVFLLEMKSSKDDFEHLRNQLQGGIALMAFLHRMGVDKYKDISSFSDVRFYATVLFHTKDLSDVTSMEKLQKEIDNRKKEKHRYASIPGVLCVEKNKISIEQLKQKSKQVSLQWCDVNDFRDFPS